MAQTEHLPIYKSAYDLCLYLEQVVHNLESGSPGVNQSRSLED